MSTEIVIVPVEVVATVLFAAVEVVELVPLAAVVVPFEAETLMEFVELLLVVLDSVQMVEVEEFVAVE